MSRALVSMSNLLDRLTKEDWDRIVASGAAKLKEQQKLAQDFYDSPKCEYLIQSIKDAGESIDNETVAYFFKKMKHKFKWVNVTEQDVSMFFKVMSSSKIGTITNQSSDEACMFGNIQFEKRGLFVSIMVGQGTSIMIGTIK